MMSSRRDFLRASLAAPLAFELAGCSRAPAWYFDALRAMRQEGKQGLAFRVPADAKRRCGLGHDLAWLVERTDAAGLEVTLQAVLLCLDDEAMRRWVDGAREGEDLVLIDGEGRAQDGARLDPQGDVAEQAAALLEGPGLRRLRERAAAVRAAAVPEDRAAYDRSLEAGPLLAASWALPLLVLLHHDGIGYRTEAAIQSLAPPAVRLPYGASMTAGSPASCKENPACPAGMGCGVCGMARVTPRSQAFVKFLAV